jgi:hypothetical protein
MEFSNTLIDMSKSFAGKMSTSVQRVNLVGTPVMS